jgi:hypothetical protein
VVACAADQDERFDRIERFTADGAVPKDGSTVPADRIVSATGTYPQIGLVRRAFGEEMVERIGASGGPSRAPSPKGRGRTL